MGSWTPFNGEGLDPWRVQAPAGEVVLPGVSTGAEGVGCQNSMWNALLGLEVTSFE